MATPIYEEGETPSSSGESPLNEEQLSALVHFKDISGISEDDVAKQILESNSWDLEKAVHHFMGYGDPSEPLVRRRYVSPPTVDLSPQNQHVYYPARRHSPWYIKPFSWMLVPVRFTCHVVYDFIRIILSFIWPDPRRSLTDPAGDVRNFIADFRQKYVPGVLGDQDESETDRVIRESKIPPFFDGTYSEALREAKQSLRFLIIYLHGDSHEDTDSFCRQTLLDPILLSFLDNPEQVIFWACNVNSPEGYRVSQTFREHTYPFIGVVGLSANSAYSRTPYSSTRMALLGRIEGFTSAPILIEYLSKIMNDHQSILTAERADRAERELSTRLRREQDEAFAASLAQDRAKAAERAASEEAVARLAREAAEARRRDELLGCARLRRQRRWANSLPEQPTPSSDVVCISLKLPNGRRTQRLFSFKDSLKLLYYFIISQEDAPKQFSVASNYPKRVIECRPAEESDIEDYTPDKEACEDEILCKPVKDWTPNGTTDPPSFEEAGLVNHEMLLILDMDS